jgi:hypothetical protein
VAVELVRTVCSAGILAASTAALSNRPAADFAYSKEEPTGSASGEREIRSVSDQPAVGSEEPAAEPGELFRSFQGCDSLPQETPALEASCRR